MLYHTGTSCRESAHVHADATPTSSLLFRITHRLAPANTLSGHRVREHMAPCSRWQWLLRLCCWHVTGLDAAVSWRHSGQTLSIRPWQLV
ncbi:hypothetical protein FUT69_10585 [Xylella taiwanensis]|uniref:Uncharacterized protein n=1 Tax=Xylella taiwanensis TaxID=1444770 RepID=A0ABS8TVI5_9GAMM|nr:hypothetical protein [Xylella taiwanensis]MCD8455575.1 hypothetical protein [Xylella taiwanensis]MCD8457982.1 hypothetical protein [Xylella taiwanensis]MCD8460117.1 hypothetical protein [Xylella taiwanensis]MCD8463824.1 hypothetical protein [Xylella taiwanensis]MCD8464620.1 hypothetical protein [Xylella taiwanensis]